MDIRISEDTLRRLEYALAHAQATYRKLARTDWEGTQKWRTLDTECTMLVQRLKEARLCAPHSES